MPWTIMYWLDTLYLGLLALAAVLGAWTGLLWQAARLVSLAVAAYAALALHEPAAAWTEQNLAQGAAPTVIHVGAYLGVFLAVYVLLYLASRVLYQALTVIDLQALDRWGGALLGAAKMALVLAGFSLAAVHCAHPGAKELLHQATLAPAFAHGLDTAITAMPENYKNHLHQTWNEVGVWMQESHAPKNQLQALAPRAQR